MSSAIKSVLAAIVLAPLALAAVAAQAPEGKWVNLADRKSTRLNSSHT